MSPVDLEIFRELARHLASGHSVEQAAQDMDLPSPFLETLVTRPDFLKQFADERPEAFATWERARQDEQAEQVVKHLARGNAVRNFRALQALADGVELKSEAKANVLRELLKMSGTISDDAKVEMIRLPASQITALLEAAKEIAP